MARATLAKSLHKVEQHISTQAVNLVDKILAEAESSRPHLIERRLTITLTGNELVVHDQLDKIMKATQAFEDVGSATAKLDPLHAGLP